MDCDMNRKCYQNSFNISLNSTLYMVIMKNEMLYVIGNIITNPQLHPLLLPSQLPLTHTPPYPYPTVNPLTLLPSLRLLPLITQIIITSKEEPHHEWTVLRKYVSPRIMLFPHYKILMILITQLTFFDIY